MRIDPDRMMTITLTHEIWDHICDRLGDYADQAEDQPMLGDCFDCDRARPGKCPQHQAEAEYGAEVRGYRDQIVAQLGAQNSTVANLVKWADLRMDIGLRKVLPDTHRDVRNPLMLHGDILTIGELAARSDDDLLEIKGFGKAKLARLKSFLHGLAQS
ncbi:hypothetical protein [Streptosporangium lutulentum]|uniref:RNA polymerase alpha subunit C-terminal domain-containing protein n=1 Tax=Streptosporangium lutulentum TaxID=1461250 RepID=A0ABT9Q9E5_9ACTN|nr:hypothetical protein [Streptosporangium lutulentum]MDP9843344.1 hypothetical protein [Streptosporangium lutulentum]